MQVIIVVWSKHGSTRSIAETVGDELRNPQSTSPFGPGGSSGPLRHRRGTRPVPENLAAGIGFRGGPTMQLETGCSHGSAIVTFASESTFGITLLLSELALTPTDTCDD